MASRRTVRAAAKAPSSPVTTPQARCTAATAPRPLALAVHLALAASLVAAAGWSPGVQAQSAQAAEARAEEVRQYDIPAGPLSEVLTLRHPHEF